MCNSDSPGAGSNLELSLLVVSIFTSFILYSISVKAASRIYDKGRRPLQFAFIFFFAALAANGVIVATVVLGYKRKISLDAIAAVVFALIPGLVSFPRDAFIEVFVYATIIYLRVLPVRYKNFSYVTFGRACNEDMLPEDTPFTGCSGEACTANIYIRKLMLSNMYFPTLSTKIFRSRRMRNRIEQEPQKSSSLFKRCFSRRPEADAIRWNGLVVQHENSVVTVRNIIPVPEQKWYLQLSSAIWLVMQPWTVHLSRPAQVVCALRVISDIMSIGRLIILFRGEVISEITDELDFDKDHKAKAALQICNSIIKEIGLNEWGQLDMEQIRNLETNSYTLDQLGEMYSLILLLVIYKSNLFGDWFHRESGQEETDNFYKFDDDETDEYLTKMEEGTSIASITKLEPIEVEHDPSVKYGMQEETKDCKLRPKKGSKAKQQKISRAERIAGFLRWVGWLVYGTMPFHDPLEVAQFRHIVTSFKIIKKIQKVASNGKCTCEVEGVMEEKVDQWLASWKCKITKSLNMS